MISYKEAKSIAADIIEGTGRLAGDVLEADDCWFFDWVTSDGTREASSGPILVEKDLGECWIIPVEATQEETAGARLRETL